MKDLESFLGSKRDDEPASLIRLAKGVTDADGGGGRVRVVLEEGNALGDDEPFVQVMTHERGGCGAGDDAAEDDGGEDVEAGGGDDDHRGRLSRVNPESIAAEPMSA